MSNLNIQSLKEHCQTFKVKHIFQRYLQLPVYVRLEIVSYLVRYLDYAQVILIIDPKLRESEFNGYWNRIIIQEYPNSVIPRITKPFSICDFYMLNLLSELTRQVRKDMLDKALTAAGLEFREDSKLCKLWLNNQLKKGDKNYHLKDVIRTMAECKWIYDYQSHSEKLRKFQLENPDMSRAECFSIVKAEILKEHPLPDPYPWNKRYCRCEEDSFICAHIPFLPDLGYDD